MDGALARPCFLQRETQLLSELGGRGKRGSRKIENLVSLFLLHLTLKCAKSFDAEQECLQHFLRESRFVIPPAKHLHFLTALPIRFFFYLLIQ